jgi:hypothetical protein
VLFTGVPFSERRPNPLLLFPAGPKTSGSDWNMNSATEVFEPIPRVRGIGE